MSWPAKVAIAYLVLNTLLFLAQIGKPRNPRSPAEGIESVLAATFIILAIVRWA